jgi:hypothetical protein
MKTIKSVLFFVVIPYVVAWYVLRGNYGKSSGHTSGICEGIVMFGAFVSGAMQIMVAILVFLIWLVL